MSEWRWFGRAGHFIGAHNCQFHLHTHVRGYCISTIGEYYPESAGGEMAEVGFHRYYETFVFALGTDDAPKSWTEIDTRGYGRDDLEAAQKGHLEMCRKYAKGASDE